MTVNTNQITSDVAGCGTGLNSYIGSTSSSRLTMMGGMLSQMLVVEGATPKRILAGPEAEYGNATFKVVMPCDAKIVAVIDKFPTKIGANSFKKNTESVIIYENLESRHTLQLGMLTLTTHHYLHQSFGFKYRQTEAQRSLIPGEIIPAGTVFCESPNITPNGNYKYGLEANVVFMSIPQVIEDGFVVSKSFCERLATNTIGVKQASWGKKMYPINLYGDDENYKPFPDIGDKVRPDGLLFALREYDPLLAACEMDLASLQEYDPVFDKTAFAEAGAEIIDIKVMHDHNQGNPPTPIGMESQPARYANAQSEFYRQIIKVYEEHKRKTKNLEITKELHRLIIEAFADDPKQSEKTVTRTYRATPLDDWTVDIKYAKRITASEAFKLSGLFGDKGVSNIACLSSDIQVILL